MLLERRGVSDWSLWKQLTFLCEECRTEKRQRFSYKEFRSKRHQGR